MKNVNTILFLNLEIFLHCARSDQVRVRVHYNGEPVVNAGFRAGLTVPLVPLGKARGFKSVLFILLLKLF